MTDSPLSLPEDWDQWTPEAKEKFYQALQQIERKRYVWYCKRGRTCDGEPHDEYDYPHARGDQWPPKGTDWFVWLVMSGRGAGKTRGGSEWTRKMSELVPRIALIGRRGPDIRGTMVEGRSGLIKVCERAGVPFEWYPSKKEFHFANGCIATGFSAEEPDSLRGVENGAAWLDEPAHMPLIEAVWDMLLMGLRIDGIPGGAKALCTSTPLPLKWLKKLQEDPRTVTVRVPTHVNLKNLDPQFRRNIIDKYEGTRIGRQELYGEILEDIEGAMWNHALIEENRDTVPLGDLMRIVVAIDPSGTSSKKRDETGIIVVGIVGRHFYVLADYSGHYTPDGWAEKAWEAFDAFHADTIVAEKNYGGEMVLSTLRNKRPNGPTKLVWSRRGKQLRAEPIVGLYEQKRVHHVEVFPEMEAQMCEWVPGIGDSPDRVDALVHGITELSGENYESAMASPAGHRLGGGGLTSTSKPISPKLFGLPERKAPVETEEERLRRVVDTLMKPKDMPDCLHEESFEHYYKSGVLVCRTCLHEVDWVDDVLVRVDA